MATAAERPQRFLPAEWEALLAAPVVGRPVSDEQRERLRQVLREAGAWPAAAAPSAAPTAPAPTVAVHSGRASLSLQGAMQSLKRVINK